MKEIYLIAIAFLASQVAASAIAINKFTFEAEDECPATDTCPPKLIAHESDCSRYYECRNTDKVLKVCKEGLHFSKAWYGCVKPDKADCGQPVDPTKCNYNGELLPHECQCTKFYECKANLKALRECPVGQFFDKDRRTCIRGDNCKPTGTECENGELLTHECQCNKYYLCKNGQKALRECDKGWHFNPSLPSPACVKGTVCPANNTNSCHHGDKKSHDCYCENYFLCKSNDWILQECKKGEHFSPSKLACMDSSKAGCEGSEDDEPGTCPDGVPTRFKHECDCRLFYECDKNNKKVLQSCDWGRYFDYLNQVCELAEKVSSKCKNSWDKWL